MKPDNFDDSIRRKLDGIEPVFREKDWAQMQQVMRHHGLLTPWSAAPSWLMPAAGVVSVAALLTTTVWLGHTNQQLRQDVQRLNQTVTQLRQTPPAAPRTDTVYVTRLLPTPTNSQNSPSIERNVSVLSATPTRDNAVAAQSQTDVLSRQVDRPTVATSAPTEPRPDQTQLNRTSAPERQPDRTRLNAARPNRTRPDLNPSTNRANPTVGATDEPNRRNEAVERPNAGTVPGDVSESRVARDNGLNRNQPATGTDRVTIDRVTPDRVSIDRSAGSNGRVETGTSSATPGQTGVVTSTGNRNPTRSDGTGSPDKQTELTAPVTVERLANKPMRLDSADFDEAVSRAVRRLRRLYPAKALPVLPDAAPKAIAVVTPNDRFRLGVSAELGLNQWSLGIYGDVLLGRHFLVGLGLERVNISGGQFPNDIKFYNQTHRDFRRDYAGGIDRRYDIIDINRHSLTWQVPVTLGYRIPLSYGIALTPAVGFSTSLTAREIVSFMYQRGPADYHEVQLMDQRPVNWYHSWSTSLGVEKRWGALTVQVSPYIVGPFTNGPLGLNGISGGLRLRTLYSF